MFQIARILSVASLAICTGSALGDDVLRITHVAMIRGESSWHYEVTHEAAAPAGKMRLYLPPSVEQFPAGLMVTPASGWKYQLVLPADPNARLTINGLDGLIGEEVSVKSPGQEEAVTGQLVEMDAKRAIVGRPLTGMTRYHLIDIKNASIIDQLWAARTNSLPQLVFEPVAGKPISLQVKYRVPAPVPPAVHYQLNWDGSFSKANLNGFVSLTNATGLDWHNVQVRLQWGQKAVTVDGVTLGIGQSATQPAIVSRSADLAWQLPNTVNGPAEQFVLRVLQDPMVFQPPGPMAIHMGVESPSLEGTVNAEEVGVANLPRGLPPGIKVNVRRTPEQRLAHVDGIWLQFCTSTSSEVELKNETDHKFLFALVTPTNVTASVLEGAAWRRLGQYQDVELDPNLASSSMTISTCGKGSSLVVDARQLKLDALSDLLRSATPLQQPVLQQILDLRTDMSRLQNDRDQLQPLIETARLQRLLGRTVYSAEVRQAQRLDEQIAVLGQQLLELSLQVAQPARCECSLKSED